MSRSQKDKGYRGEHHLKKILTAEGIKCERVPLSGAFPLGPSCDLLIGDEQSRGEVKIRGNGFKSLYSWLANNNYLFVKADFKPYLVVIALDDFVDLFKRAMEVD